MRRRILLLLFWYAVLILLVVLSAIFPLLHISVMDLAFWSSKEQLILTLVLLVLVLTFFLTMLVQTVSFLSTQTMRHAIQRILQNKSISAIATDDAQLMQLSDKVESLTKQVQQLDNQVLVTKESIIEGERKRIARDLHDTVSQELFASSMVLSGLAGNLSETNPETVQEQLMTVKNMVESAQKDLRVLLLHLRPSELNGKSLVQGFETLLKEVSDKSAIRVSFHQQVADLPTQIEEHLFRIAQEIISNVLRHSKAQHLDVYLLQRDNEVQLKMTDDGVGFVASDEEDSISYGLQNIRERVEDMAGTLKIRTAPHKGVAIDIRVPLLKGRKDEEN